MSLRTIGRLAVVAVLAATGLVVASPAQALAPLTASIACEPTTRLHVFCISTVSGGLAPYTRNWFYNNRYFPAQDNKVTTSWSCKAGGPNVYGLAVIDANFEIFFTSAGSGCNSGNP